ncbi:hypothetical protein DB32_000841 [Sandaracinus amylolyticus]|uniref:Uncharacterized protein n=1 Tax=Sandaracinus amylolyticus TaxID=927083 RepID=A0A0F6VZN1_9BACT|nr:hypothetical protein DB32_000841 [Sandaracinus amylolyticus]
MPHPIDITASPIASARQFVTRSLVAGADRATPEIVRLSA